jgi:hypothetical protein
MSYITAFFNMVAWFFFYLGGLDPFYSLGGYFLTAAVLSPFVIEFERRWDET